MNEPSFTDTRTLPEKVIEGIGQILGTIMLRPIFEGFALASLRYNVTGNIETLSKTLEKSKPAVIVINHIGPVNKEGQLSRGAGITPDVMLQQTIIQRTTGQRPVTIAINNIAWNEKQADSSAKTFIKLLQAGFQRGFLAGAGLLPVDKAIARDGTVGHNQNDLFFKRAIQKLSQGKILTFFAEGVWRTPQHDYNNSIKIRSGAIVVSREAEKVYGKKVPIIPIYIHCSDDWDNDREVHVYSGEPIYVKERGSVPVKNEIENSIIALQKRAIQETPNLLSTIIRSEK